MANTFDLTGDNRILQGADYAFSLTLKDSSNTAINLTGATVTSQIKSAPGGTLLASFGVAIPSPATGVINFSLASSVTGGLATTWGASYYRYDVLMTKSGVKTRLLEGNVEVDPAITT
jgi:hypothetical protein